MGRKQRTKSGWCAAVFVFPLLIAVQPGFCQTKAAGQAECDPSAGCIKITSKASLVHLGSLDSFDMTEAGKRAAMLLMSGIQGQDKEAVALALKTYTKIIPDENFGGEYTALAWFAEYYLAAEDVQKEMLKNPLTADYFHFFADGNWAVLKEYLNRKYHLERVQDPDPEAGRERAGFLEDFILFNNPRRESWEKTSKIIEVLNIKPGQSIADIGSGPGYYTMIFSNLVGKDGKVYAIDINKKHVEYLDIFIKKNNVTNVVEIESRMNDIMLKEKVDLAFLCSLYHIIYATSMERVKDEFIQSIKDSLKDDGRLVIVDNALVESSNLPYHGPYIAKELIIAQLKYYGFKLEATHQFIPQRYVLIFKKEL